MSPARLPDTSAPAGAARLRLGLAALCKSYPAEIRGTGEHGLSSGSLWLRFWGVGKTCGTNAGVGLPYGSSISQISFQEMSSHFLSDTCQMDRIHLEKGFDSLPHIKLLWM